MSLHFHPLTVKALRPDTEEATIVSFDIPDEHGFAMSATMLLKRGYS